MIPPSGCCVPRHVSRRDGDAALEVSEEALDEVTAVPSTPAVAGSRAGAAGLSS